MQGTVYSVLVERIQKKISGASEEPNIKLKSLSSFANSVYKVEILEDENPDLRNRLFLFKSFREYLVEFSNKSVENEVVSVLSSHNLYPQVYFTDKTHRLQQFIVGYAPGVENVTMPQLTDIIQKLAKMVTIFKHYAQSKPQVYQNQRKISHMFPIFDKVTKECEQIHPQSYQLCKEVLNKILCPQIRGNLEKIVCKQLVPTHNDCHFHNVLIRNSDQNLFLIDFEFFSPNYRGFELGNFFNEYATDYKTFEIREQLELPSETKNLLINQYYHGLGCQISHEEAQKEVETGRILSHLFWLFIGVKQVKDPKITIDMHYYIQRRYEEFMKLYKKLVI